MIAKQIKEIRKLMGLTQTEFAEKTGMTISAVSQIESGERKPAYETLQKIIKAFNLNPKALFPNEDKKWKKETIYHLQNYIIGDG